MSIRREPLYIQTSTWRILWLLSKALEITPDEIADELLTKVLAEKYPRLMDHLTEINRLEKEAIKDIK